MAFDIKAKVEELAEMCANMGANTVIFNNELSGMQIRNLEDDIGDGVSVIDRSMLILDIFALHATSGEGKLQVELAQLKYTAPRLVGKGKDLSRQEGRIGTRGPGESKLETDRRHLNERIHSLENQLKELNAKLADAKKTLKYNDYDLLGMRVLERLEEITKASGKKIVLCKTFDELEEINQEYISFILCRNEIEKTSLLNMLRKTNPKQFALYRNLIKVCKQDMFLKNGLFITDCRYYNGGIVIKFAD